MKTGDSSEKYTAIKIMLGHAMEIREKVDELYNAIPRDDYYRLQQLLDGAIEILKKLQL